MFKFSLIFLMCATITFFSGCESLPENPGTLTINAQVRKFWWPDQAVPNKAFDVYVVLNFTDGSHSYWANERGSNDAVPEAKTNANGDWSYTIDPANVNDKADSRFDDRDENAFIGTDPLLENCFEQCVGDGPDSEKYPHKGRMQDCSEFQINGCTETEFNKKGHTVDQIRSVRVLIGFVRENGDYMLYLGEPVSHSFEKPAGEVTNLFLVD